MFASQLHFIILLIIYTQPRPLGLGSQIYCENHDFTLRPPPPNVCHLARKEVEKQLLTINGDVM